MTLWGDYTEAVLGKFHKNPANFYWIYLCNLEVSGFDINLEIEID
jgi:hypothetical protein